MASRLAVASLFFGQLAFAYPYTNTSFAYSTTLTTFVYSTTLTTFAYSTTSTTFADPTPPIKGPNDFTWHIASAPAKSVQRRSDGSIAMAGINLNCSIAGQFMHAFLDTASDQFSTNGQYNASKSATAVPILNATWETCYNDGCYRGCMVLDDVSFGTAVIQQALLATCSSIDNCTGTGPSNVGMQRALTVPYKITDEDGNESSAQGPSFFGSIVPTLSQSLWTLDVQREENVNGPGSLDFGFLDPNKYAGDVAYIPNEDGGHLQGFWQSHITGYGITNGGSNNNTRDIYFFLDTGTPTMSLPEDIVDSFFGTVDGAFQYENSNNWGFPCNATLPDFLFPVNGTIIIVKGYNFNGGDDGNGEHTCFSMLKQGGAAADSGHRVGWGLPFIQGVFLVHRYDDDDLAASIGFANKAVSYYQAMPS